MTTARWTILGSSPRTSLVLQHGNRQRALSPIRLRDEPPPRRLRPVRSPMDPFMQVLDPAIEVRLVVLPCQSVGSGGSVPPEGIERRPQHGDIDMVEKRGEPCLPVPCSFPTGSSPVAGSCGPAAVTRLPGPVPGACVAVPHSPRPRPPPSQGQALGSTHSASGGPELFAGFTATMAGSDFSASCIAGFGSSPSRRGPAACAPGQG